MIFSNFFKNRKESFVLPLTGMDNSLKKYPLNDFENNFFYGFKSKYPQYYSGMSFNRMSNGMIKFSYRSYPIGAINRKGVLFVERDMRFKDPWAEFSDPLNHYDDIVACIKRKLK